MISEKYKCIFVHIPKTAGQSVEHFFLNLHGLTWDNREGLLLKHNPDEQKGPESLAHLKASEYISCGHIQREIFDSYFKFSLVRNPWARIFSEYNYRQYHKEMSFRKFILTGLPEESFYADTYRHIMPQYDFLYDDFGNLLVDFVGKFENLQKDFDLVCTRLGIQNTLLPHVNPSSKITAIIEKLRSLIAAEQPKIKASYVEHYDTETRAIVSDIYSRDITAFEYKFGE